NVLYEANTLVADYSGNLSGGTSMFFPATGNNVNIYAIHGAQFSETTLPDSFTHAVPTDQSSMGTTYTNADLLFAAEKNVKRLGNPTTCNLNFYHMLSKVEVAIVSGNGAPQLAVTGGLALNNVYTQCTVAFDKDADLTVRNNRCDLILGVDVLGSIKMTNAMNTDFSNGRIFYNEALVVPQVVELAEMVFTLAEGGELKYKLPTGMEFESGKKYRFQITLNLTGVEVTTTITDWECDDVITGSGEAPVKYDTMINLASLTDTYVINDSRKYYFFGIGSYGVSVESGSPELTFNDVEIETEGNGINIEGGGSPTVVYEGSCYIGAGVAVNVAAGTLTITNSGNVTLESSSAAKGAINLTDGANLNISGGVFSLHNLSDYFHDKTTPAIGSEFSKSCGDIRISGATIGFVYSDVYYFNPIVGAAANSQCGNITIENSTISCKIKASAAIGTAHSTAYSSSCGIITLNNCDLNITRVSWDDFVGAVVGCAATMESGGNSSADTYVQAINITLKPGQTKEDFLATIESSYPNPLVGCPEESKLSTLIPGGVHWYDSNGNEL
ncbi:MAG: fimbrillin family protein, partial [Candidatus Limisoma sp.]